MGWVQSCIANIELNKTSYHNTFDVERDIETNEEVIDIIKNRILRYAITNPKDYMSGDSSFEETLSEIDSNIKADLEELSELIWKNFKLGYFKSFWETRSGEFTENPDYKENIKNFVKTYIIPEIDWQKELKNKKGSE